MGNSHDYVALDWVRGEIDDTLNQARQALEAYVDNTEDTSRMRFCLNYIHQVHGTLQMVEFYGAALLAEEMEKLAQALLNQAVPDLQEAVEVLMQAVLQLPSYLEHLHAGRKDLPLVILPILNDLRASRGESLLSDTSLFTPDLSAARIATPAGAVQRLQDPKVVASLRKLRQMFQFSLAGVIRGNEVKANTAYMVKVLTRVERLCQNTALGQLWSVAIAFIDVFDDNELELTSATKTLLRDLDHQIKRLIDESVDVLLQPVPEDLLKHLLYYVAKSSTDTEHVNKVRERFHLNQSLPKDKEVDEERQRMQGPDKEAIASVVAALNEELARIKDQLDLFVRGEFRDNADLEELLPGLKQVANTMAVLGLGIPRKVILEQVDVIETLIEERGEAEDITLMDIAGALLYVEATLSGMTEEHASPFSANTESDIPAEQIGNAHDAVLRETRNGLEQAKTCIVNFIASQWDHAEIENVPAILDGLRGGLQIIPLTKAAELINSCNQYIQQALLSNKTVPDWKQLDTLADAITSIEYYIERLTEGAQDNELILQVAEESVTELGFPPGEIPTYNEAHSNKEDSAETTLSDLSPDAPSKESDAELIDDEIIEIFIEEAEEVLATIAEFYPKFVKDHQHKDAIVELRRAYHTLKGSGRLVGAATLGELAWSIENMLNRVLDNTISVTASLFPLLEAVNQKLPQLVNDFKEKQPSEDVSDLIDQANVLAGVPRSGANKVANTEESEPAIELSEAPSTTEAVDEGKAPDETEQDTVESNTANEVSSPSAPPRFDEEDLIDDEIIEIFIEEAEEVLETIAEYLPTYINQHDNSEALTELRRAFHTLKGSGRMVNATTVGELSWAAEDMMNRIIDGSIVMSHEIGETLSNATELLPDLIEDFKLQQAPRHDVTALIERANLLAQGESALAAESSTTTNDSSLENELDTDSGVDPVLLDIFRSETDTHLETINEFVEAAEAEGEIPFTDAISRALHTLKGSANTAGISPIAAIIVPVEKFVKDARAVNIPANPAVSNMLRQAAVYVRQGIEQLYNDPQHHIDGTEEFLTHLNELSELSFADVSDIEQAQSTTTDPQLISIFLTEGVDILLDAESILDNWRNNPVPGEELEKLVGELKTLSQGAQVAGLEDICEFAELLESAYELIESGDVVANDKFLDTIAHGHEALLSLMDQVAAGLATQPNNKLIAEIKELILNIQADNAVTENEAREKAAAEAEAAEEQTQLEQDALKELDEELEIEIPTLSGFEIDEEIPTLDIEEPASALPQLTAEDSASLLDPELVEIFLEEANDIVNNTGELLQQWSEDTTNPDLLIELQRELHTLKGGARLADISSIGDLSHELETLFEGLTEQRLVAAPSLVTLLFSCHDRLATIIDDVSSGNSGKPAVDLIEQIQQVISTAGEPVATNQVEETTDEQEATTPTSSAESEPLDDTVSAEDSQQAPMDLDPELIEIFLEEANDIIENSGNLIQQWQEDPSQHQTVNELQRELHTLKGGARMAEISAIGDLAHELESLFERIVDGQINTDNHIIDLSLSVHDRLATMVDDIGAGRISQPAPELIGQITAIIDGEPSTTAADESLAELSLEESTDLSEETAEQFIDAVNEEVDAEDALSQLPTLELEEDETDEPNELEIALPDVEAATEEDTPAELEAETLDVEPILSESLDPELVEIFLEEANEIIDNTGELLQSWLEDINDSSHVKELQRELHTLKGGARMAEIGPLGDLAHELETLFEGIVDNGLVVDSSISDLMLACHDKLATMVDQIGSGSAIYPALDLIAAVVALTNGDPVPTPSSKSETSATEEQPVVEAEETTTEPEDESALELEAPTLDEESQSSEQTPVEDEVPSYEISTDDTSEQDFADDLMSIFLDEAREICDAIIDSLDHWSEAPESLNGVVELQRELHTLKGGARLADIDNIGDLADALYDKLEAAIGQNATNNPELIKITSRSTEQLNTMLNELESTGKSSSATDCISAINAITIEADKSVELEAAARDDADDAEILEIFLEEANEILEELDTQLSDWSTDSSNDDFNREIQRLLHTLKGGARLAGLKELGNVSHELESKLIEALEKGDGLNNDLHTMVNQYQDKLNSLVTEVNHRFIALSAEQATPDEHKKPALEQPISENSTDAEQPETAQGATDTQAASVPSTAVSPSTDQQDRVTTTAKKPASQAKQAAKARPAQQETVRVSASLIDDLVNLAGETSITRGRLEQQISDFSFNLDEMVSTIERLREQLRRMDMETEAQVLFRTEKEGVGPDYADFDPLEMDRYSSIQQLSRALTESTFDLLDLRETLADKARDAETLLLQQSRIHTELQEGLMKTRMIPFSSMVPRLRRIVRQISGELGKKAEFDVQNAEGEMDRTVLERMVAPLEHMLRNALDHGIESIEKRKAAGKPEAGNISLSLNREGGDIVLRMKDDGGGISVDVIREKAIKQGLMKKGAPLSNHDILQFIMKAGFSTAEQVTQISGRGVGMDVVASEIKMLGGNISIDSREGAGTTFTVRLPFTVSVNRALMVNTGEDFYAIPLNTIEGIVRVSPYELEEYYKPDAPLYEYAGQQYRLQYLGNVLHSDHKPKLQGQPLPLPVILVRGTDHPIALQVDSLMGSREIVVKSLGAQFSKVPGVSGATILGDGSVVVILDLPALIRADDGRALSNIEHEVETPAAVEQRPTLVMVVDDSVTVRKVTTRLLERNGMDVITAKDGVDAIAQLQDNKPDVMLLDIEMPRMDGFEVASLVRHDENLKDVPICMITSRTGQKHRERAMSIGVNEYLGKPFQEKELLSTIEKLINLS
ncbi:Hpt domain-containing protein [Alkalimarinus alittae]|uniref:histidine kinase n=1 Tax=Alkalimarinus alittae TaxID=2961619 RepID=A0ABY6N343_9ALTE|nr:Hpt domain-containing protein [Alkalimarinus alittae]UZE96533.1 Hpt domain-containing protein [Alkalimarinus alittae]